MEDLLLQPAGDQSAVDAGSTASSAGPEVRLRDPFRKKRRWRKMARLSGQSSASQGNQRRHNRRRERLNTELLVGTAAGNLHEVERCLLQGASPNATCSPTWTSAAHAASLLGRAGVLQLLLDKGADPLLRLRDGSTLLHLAAWGGDSKCAEAVVRAAPDLVSCPLKPGTDQLLDEWRDSCQHDHDALTAKLPTLSKESTPLHVASQRANVDVIKVLLEHQADVRAVDEDGLTPLDVIGELVSPDSEESHSLVRSIEALLAADAWTAEEDDNANQYRTTPVHAAVKLRDLPAIKLLAESEVSPLVFDQQGSTPLHLAVTNKLDDCLKELLQAYENSEMCIADVLDIRGQTALHQAVTDGWLEGVCILLEAGADVSIKDAAMGLTPVHIAAEENRLDILREFIAIEDIDAKTLNIADNTGDTPLALAVESRSLACVKLLLKEGADVSKVIADNSTVLHRAAKYNEPEILEELLKGVKLGHPALLNATVANTGETALHMAARSGNLQCCKLLLAAGCDATLRSSVEKANTPLHLAASAGHTDVVSLLLESQPEALELEDAAGRTPLLLACKNGRRDCARLLIEAGADLSADCTEDARSFTAMDYLFNKTPRPVLFLRGVFDGAVSINDYPPDDHNCEVTVDFSVLMPCGKHVGQMKVMDAFVNTGNTFRQYELLLHPLVKCFLFLKWRRLSAMFYVMLLDFILFVLALTALCLDLYLLPDRGHDVLFHYSVDLWRIMTFLFVGIFFLQEIGHAIYFSKFYLMELESWLKWTCFVLAVITASLDRDDSQSWRRDLAALSVLLSWTELMFLLSRVPRFGYFVLMFFKVITNMVKVLLTFVFIFLGFTLSFMILFEGESPFTTPLHSFTKVIVMMTGELEYSDMFDDAAHWCSRLVFLAFVLLVGVVLMNLMVGLAVSDISVLENKGLIERLRKQVDFLRMLEYFLYSERFLRCLPAKAAAAVVDLRNVREVYKIYPGRTDSDISDVLTSDLRHEIMVHVLEKRKADMEYTIKDVYDKVCEILDPNVPCDALSHKSFKDQNVLNVLTKLKEEVESIRTNLFNKTGLNRSISQPGVVPGKIDVLIEKVDSISSTLNFISKQLSHEHHVINIS